MYWKDKLEARSRLLNSDDGHPAIPLEILNFWLFSCKHRSVNCTIENCAKCQIFQIIKESSK